MLSSVVLTWVYHYFCTTIFCMVFQFGFLRKEKRLSLIHLLSVNIFLFYLMNVYMRTDVGGIWKFGRTMFRINLIPFFIPSDEFGINISDVLNVIMLMPLGFLLPTIWPQFRSIKKVALTGFFFSLAIEISQLLNGRLADINDLIMNTLGAILGYLIHNALFKIWEVRNEYMEKFTYLIHNDLFKKVNKGKTDNKVSSLIVEHEAIFYLICSFIGAALVNNIVFFFFFKR